MKPFQKVWTKEKHDWMMANVEKSKVAMFEKFKQAFPNANVTLTAFKNECSRVGAVAYHLHPGTREIRPIGSEQLKKGYVKVKIAQPNVWEYKSHVVWNEIHPDDKVKAKTELVIFLDGNNRNFEPDNLAKISRKIAALINNVSLFGSSFPRNDPVSAKLRIAFANHYLELFKLYKKQGLLTTSGQLKSKIAKNHREWYRNLSPEERSKLAKKNRKPLTPEQKEKKRLYAKEWWRKKHGKKNFIE